MTTWIMLRVQLHQRSDIKVRLAADCKRNCHQCCQQEERHEYLRDICRGSGFKQRLCIHRLLKGHVCCCGSFQICICNHPWRDFCPTADSGNCIKVMWLINGSVIIPVCAGMQGLTQDGPRLWFQPSWLPQEMNPPPKKEPPCQCVCTCTLWCLCVNI